MGCTPSSTSQRHDVQSPPPSTVSNSRFRNDVASQEADRTSQQRVLSPTPVSSPPSSLPSKDSQGREVAVSEMTEIQLAPPRSTVPLAAILQPNRPTAETPRCGTPRPSEEDVEDDWGSGVGILAPQRNSPNATIIPLSEAALRIRDKYEPDDEPATDPSSTYMPPSTLGHQGVGSERSLRGDTRCNPLGQWPRGALEGFHKSAGRRSNAASSESRGSNSSQLSQQGESTRFPEGTITMDLEGGFEVGDEEFGRGMSLLRPQSERHLARRIIEWEAGVLSAHSPK